jgi:hypothetical protein
LKQAKNKYSKNHHPLEMPCYDWSLSDFIAVTLSSKFLSFCERLAGALFSNNVKVTGELITTALAIKFYKNNVVLNRNKALPVGYCHRFNQIHNAILSDK